ncbi:DNA damage-regulated autophagy modulator protein 2 [Myripristis murdjan]|uniref:DNA damage-regulated autophagy modulator protein 2-like n=1 Tax=Myripristis murdjan TaxID=586833 RepID=A0A667WA70_9TELE|nr:DNA damage-regulated autophagy modulator protein 2-like [Myripristis murdjan]
MWWCQKGVGFLPATLVAWSSATFIVNYVIAVLLGHTDPLIPYISDTSAEVPERCLFGFMLSISSFFGLATVYVRYKQVEALAVGGETRLHQFNSAALTLGCLSALGMCIVANFQESAIISVHLLGATLTFGSGVLYILIQTAMSYHMQPRFQSKDIVWARTAVGLWTMASIITMFVSSVILYDDLPGVDVTSKRHWRPGEKGYTAHLVSTVSEWSLAFSFIMFFLTYIRDFQKLHIRVQAVLHSNHLYDYDHYDVRGHVHQGERSPLLAGSI